LIKLGDEQVAAIATIPGARVCLIIKDTRREDKEMCQQIEDGHYTYILLGPEQAYSIELRSIIKEPEMQAKVGVVAIDECHLVRQREAFRPEFTLSQPVEDHPAR
jgi:superfamily II DNA helicase RecQ